MEKKTKAMYFAELKEMVMAAVEDQEQKSELVDFIDKQLENLEKRRVATAERAKKKKAESDELTNAILEKLGEDLMTVDEIVAAFNDPEVTRNKVTARLGKLVKAEAVVKETVKVDKFKRMAYRLPNEGEIESVVEV
jgi:hypothetical protein